jgi:hypothetical protein
MAIPATWMLAGGIVLGGVLVFVLDGYLCRRPTVALSPVVVLVMLLGASSYGLEGLSSAVAIGVFANGALALHAR